MEMEKEERYRIYSNKELKRQVPKERGGMIEL